MFLCGFISVVYGLLVLFVFCSCFSTTDVGEGKKTKPKKMTVKRVLKPIAGGKVRNQHQLELRLE